MINLLGFQKDKVDELLEKFVALWSKNQKGIPLVLKAPTGSGKTVMAANFVQGLNSLPNWDQDKAFIWITFSDELAMQSKDKFLKYFGTTLENQLINVSDIDTNKKLHKNDILFINWQKVVSRAAENRVLRRPDNNQERKEKGIYFEDFIENTHTNNREIVLIIDESHKHVDTALAKDIIQLINPRVTVHISATPDQAILLEAYENNGVVSVDREEVVNEGLIKEKVITQTNDDFKAIESKDLDETLLELGMIKRDVLKKQYEALGKNINPLMLIQLPNDDNQRIEAGELTKEEVATNYLLKKGVNPKRIARWFDKHKKPDFLEENNDEHDYLLFKVAAGTGWDCPRAQVLVMFRDIRVDKTYIQTIGRIMRMPEPHLKDDYKDTPALRVGYLYTNYNRREIGDNWPDGSQNNKPAIYIAKKKAGTSNVSLESSYVSRANYGDLSNSAMFQASFTKSMNDWFDIHKLGDIKKTTAQLAAKGIDLKPSVTNRLVVDAEYKDLDQILMEFRGQGKDLSHEMSRNDVEKTFTYLCFEFLREQTEDLAKISNLARSWPPFKRAVRLWMASALGSNFDYCYKVFIYDLQNEAGSKFKPALTQAIKDYKPILQSLLVKKAADIEAKEAPIFSIQNEYSYTEDFEEQPQKLCVLDKFYIRSDNTGRDNELDFVKYIDEKKGAIEWWFKNGDHGESYFAIKYFNTTSQKDALFYPDWIIKFRDGKIGIFDTKSGMTASTEGRAESLAKKIKLLGKGFVGGIVIPTNGIWYYNNSEEYKYTPSNLGSDWKPLENIFDVAK